MDDSCKCRSGKLLIVFHYVIDFPEYLSIVLITSLSWLTNTQNISYFAYIFFCIYGFLHLDVFTTFWFTIFHGSSLIFERFINYQFTAWQVIKHVVPSLWSSLSFAVFILVWIYLTSHWRSVRWILFTTILIWSSGSWSLVFFICILRGPWS